LQAAGALVGVDAFAGRDSMCGCGGHDGSGGRGMSTEASIHRAAGRCQS
jgi:hypothetical protein